MAQQNYVDLTAGSSVSYKGVNYLVNNLIDTRFISLINPVTEEVIRAEVSKISVPISKGKFYTKKVDIADLRDKDLKEAQRRLFIIKQILDDPENKLAICKKYKASSTTVYRWIKAYQASGQLSSLAPLPRFGGKGKSRLDPTIETIISECIERVYLNHQRMPIKRVCFEVNKICLERNLEMPHPNTIRNRILRISDEKILKYRVGYKAAKDKYKPILGSFPGANHVLSVVQIDHTPLDIILVSERDRIPIGKPYLTLALDVYSRTVVGFYLSFDPPSALSVGLCIAHAVLPKDIYLNTLDINKKWPCWGLMTTINTDNAKEFRGDMLQLACQEYGIELTFRKPKEPNWGGNIERFFKTLSQEVHQLPGTTFSNPQDRGEYKSIKKAALSLKEFEKWLATYIIDVYHEANHSGIAMSPMAKWNLGVFGSASEKGYGLPKKINNERKLIIDFLPFYERTIQEYGVLIDYVFYYSDILRPWIHALEPTNSKFKIKRKFIFKRDPRDISKLYFLDPDSKYYYEIPYRNTGFPAITVWEYKKAVNELNKRNEKEINENKIFEALKEMHQIETEAVAKTKNIKIKKAKEKTRISKQKHEATQKIMKETSSENKNNGSVISQFSLLADSVEPFETLDYGTQE